MVFRITPNFPGLERIDSWLQNQFDRFKGAEIDTLFVGRRFPNFYLADTDIKVLRPAEDFGTIILSASSSATTYGMFAYSYNAPFLSAIAIGSTVSVASTTTSKTNVYLNGQQVEIENNEGAGRTYHVRFI